MHPGTFTRYLTIADFRIILLSDFHIELEDGYLPFVVETHNAAADAVVRCHAGLPGDCFWNDEPVFEAKNQSQRFYSIFQVGSSLGFVIYNQQHTDKIQQVALLNEGFTNWDVYCEMVEGRLMPLKYPLGPVMLHYLTLNSDAIMMHSSCVCDGKEARLFSGFSGAGKSTMAGLWSAAGNRVINDDRIIIRKSGSRYEVHNTPMYYRDIPKKSTLKSIYLIRHSRVNIMDRLSGAAAISRVMAFSIQNNFDARFIRRRLDFLGGLCTAIPVCELGFVPGKEVVGFVMSNEMDMNAKNGTE